ncbi:MAG: T9SS C-terminal target domain-containing protein [Bacteroidetes bacterium]|nr:MAG: T9SS C-terminal target domain-containing protein [Bacteroidota bacterium]
MNSTIFKKNNFFFIKQTFLFTFTLLYSFLSFNQENTSFSRLSPTSETYIDSVIQGEINTHKLVGFSVGLIKNGEIVYLKGYGLLDSATNQAANANSIYRYASVSKTFTAISALQLWEDGLLDLSDDVRIHVPEYPVKPQGTIHVNHLLAHQSGISTSNQDNSAIEQYTVDHPNDYDAIDALDIYKNESLLFTPGTSYHYSNYGYQLASAVIARAGNAPFVSQLRSRIFDQHNYPFLQMEHHGDFYLYNQASHYNIVGGNASRVIDGGRDNTDIGFIGAAGGLVGSVRDLAQFTVDFMNNNFFDNRSTLDTMWTVHTPSLNGNYGFGVIVGTDYKGDTAITHNGALVGGNSLYFFSPESKNGIVLLGNVSGTQAYTYGPAIYKEIENLTVSGPAYTNPIPHSLIKPVINSIPNNSTCQSTNIQLDWNHVDYADEYYIEYAKAPNFNNAQQIVTKELSVYISNLQEYKDYYIRVKAVNRYLYGGTESLWSNTLHIKTSGMQVPTTLPFFEDFEDIQYQDIDSNNNFSNGNGYYWSYNPIGVNARIKAGTDCAYKISGNRSMSLDGLVYRDSIGVQLFYTNQVILNLDLINYENSTDLNLAFDYVSHGSVWGNDCDIWVRGSDSDPWLVLYDWYHTRTAQNAVNHAQNIDIDALLTSNGQKPSSGSQLMFRQKGILYTSNGMLDGITFDNISITGTPSPVIPNLKSITRCNSYTWPVNGMSYTSTGLYTDTIADQDGCDSIVNLDLTINTCSATPSGLDTRFISDVSANFYWDTIPGAISYKIMYRRSSANQWENVEFRNVQKGILKVSGLNPNTKYFWAIRVKDSGGNWSNISDVQNFWTLANPCILPSNLNTSGISSSMARITWTDASNALYYKVRYFKQGSNSKTTLRVSSGREKYWITGLDASSTYNWQIKAVCSYRDRTGTQWSNIQSFNTDPDQSSSNRLQFVEQIDELENIAVYPNPFKESFTLELPELESNKYFIEVFNILGSKMLEKSSIGGQIDIELGNADAGIYFVRINNGNEIKSFKLSKIN